MKKRHRIPILALVALTSLPLMAEEEGCEPAQQLLQCFTSTYNQAVEVGSSSAVAESENENVEAVVKQPNASEAPDTAAASKDFQRRIIAALGIGDFSEEDGAQTLSVNLSPSDSSFPVLLKALRRDPAIFGSLIEAIPEDIREARKAMLEKDLDEYGDVEISLSAGLELGERFGRNVRRYRGLSRSVFDIGAPAAPSPGIQSLLGILDERKIREQNAAGQDVERDVLVTDTVAAAGEEVATAVIAAARELAAGQLDFQRALTDRGYFDLAKLVGNQPQLHLEASYRVKDDLVGADIWKVKGTYEHPFGANVNRLRKHCGLNLDGGDWKKTWKTRLRNVQGSTRHAEVKSLWADYLKAPVKHERDENLDCYDTFRRDYASSMDNANRLSWSFEYSETDDYSFSLPDDGFSFNLDPTQQLVTSLVWGRPITYDQERQETSRVDVEAKYENSTGEAMRNDRFVATASYTLDIYSFSVVYANKPEYLGEVDEELSARVGLKFKINTKEKNQP